MGRCNPQVAKLRVNRLPTWIPQVGCYAPDSECFYPETNQGVLHVNNNGDLYWPVPGCLYINIGSPPAKIRAPSIELYYSKYRGAETVLQLLDVHVGIRNSDDHAQDAIPLKLSAIKMSEVFKCYRAV